MALVTLDLLFSKSTQLLLVSVGSEGSGGSPRTQPNHIRVEKVAFISRVHHKRAFGRVVTELPATGWHTVALFENYPFSVCASLSK